MSEHADKQHLMRLTFPQHDSLGGNLLTKVSGLALAEALKENHTLQAL